MRNLLLLIAIVGGLYHFYGKDYLEYQQGAFDEAGNPIALLFTMTDCTTPCDDAIALLERRGIEYEEILIDESEKTFERFKDHGGGNTFPLLLAGVNRLDGFNRMRMTSVLAETYGWDILSKNERRAMEHHFDSEGNPILVMYGTQTCGYCRKAEQLFVDNNVEFIDFDIEQNGLARSNYTTLEGMGTPLIYVGFRRIRGYNKLEIERALKLL